MCHSFKLITNTIVQKNTTSVHLPDGSTQLVHRIGNMNLNIEIVLQDALHIPTFLIYYQF